ncbi:glutamate--cysteine ligase [Candidatus Liberibacter sp.]|uniref:glutamate--cysteine ligase n=1 Tax=Candidatus Liberibacter sp. TaxID=34022 RepID=UPI0015F58464|nr:glutamate--cysteine ligase [Candidatus Liberibacter sp.]MBA5723837.1 glutamate--cysteine ligase [Candidatus Liberibacter sp.]
MVHNLLSETLITSTDDLVQYIAAGIKPLEDFRIGTEHESFLFLRSDYRPVPYYGEISILTILREMQKSLGWQYITDNGNIIGLKNPDRNTGISLEPGGQFELSGATLKNLHQTKEELLKYRRVLKGITKHLNIGVMSIGSNPKWTREEIPLVPKTRYKIMRKHMPKVGTNGLDMMFRTCTTQVNLDFSSERDMAIKIRVSLKLQCLATALFASSPFTDGHVNGFQSWRSEIWRKTDNNRTGILPFAFAKDFGFEHYMQWALNVPMYFIIRDGQYYDCTDINFRQFMNSALKGRVKEWRPTILDWENHLSTLFPDVRLRQCLEMRGADAGTPEKVLAVSAFWTGLLYDSSALQAADDFTSEWSFSEVNDLRNRVPYEGMNAKIRNQSLLSIAPQILSLSRAGLKRRAILNHYNKDETIFLSPLEKIISNNCTLSDEMLASYHGVWKHSIEPCFEQYSY